jgi:DNA-binding XRE family transcriptional regulator
MLKKILTQICVNIFFKKAATLHVAYLRHNDFLKNLGENLRNIRTSKGLSQEDIAFNTELSTNQIGRIERGEINTGICTLYEIAVYLNIPVKELLDF